MNTDMNSDTDMDIVTDSNTGHEHAHRNCFRILPFLKKNVGIVSKCSKASRNYYNYYSNYVFDILIIYTYI
jgi:hypothetical protein